MAKYKAKNSFNELQPRTKDNPLDLGSTECLRQGGTIEMDVVPDSLKEHLELVGTKKTQVKTETKKIDDKKGVK